MTQIELARQGTISSQVKYVAKKENIAEEILQQSIIDGHIVIPANSNHVHLVPCGIGKGLRIKINANIGTSSDYNTLDKELEKLRVAVEFGADTVMDLSTGGDITAIHHMLGGVDPI